MNDPDNRFKNRYNILYEIVYSIVKEILRSSDSKSLITLLLAPSSIFANTFPYFSEFGVCDQ